MNEIFARHDLLKRMSRAEYRDYLKASADEIRLNRQADQLIESVHLPKDNKVQTLNRVIAKWMVSLPHEDLLRPWRMEDLRLQLADHDPGSIGKALRTLGWVRLRKADPSPYRSDYRHRWYPPGAQPEIKPELSVDALRAHLGPKLAPVKVDALRMEFHGQDGRPPKRASLAQCLRDLGFEQRRDALSLRWWAPSTMSAKEFHQFTCPGTRAPTRRTKSPSPNTRED
jgi:hypothetical protein